MIRYRVTYEVGGIEKQEEVKAERVEWTGLTHITFWREAVNVPGVHYLAKDGQPLRTHLSEARPEIERVEQMLVLALPAARVSRIEPDPETNGSPGD